MQPWLLLLLVAIVAGSQPGDLCADARLHWRARMLLEDAWTTPLRNPFKLPRPTNSSDDIEINRRIRNKVPIYLKFHKGA